MKGANLAARYSKELRRRFGLWPTWLPDSPLAVGDFGRIEKGVFVRQGSTQDLGIKLETKAPQAYSDQLFASHDVRHLLLGGNASGASTGAARARIEFGRAFGVFVGLHECREVQLADTISLAHQLARCREAGRWPDGRCVVTGVVEARSALIAIGSDARGSLELTAAAPVPDLLAMLGSEIQIATESSIDYRSISTAGSTPLSRLSRLTNSADLVTRGDPPPSSRLMTLDARAGLVTD